jgi:hypothetical protein
MEVGQGPNWGCSAIKKDITKGYCMESQSSIPGRDKRFLNYFF